MALWYPAPPEGPTADDLAARFREVHGHPPEGVWAAPGRVNVIGEHVDYTGGLCLPFALPHRTFVALAARDDGLIEIRSTQASEWRGRLADVAPGGVSGWAAYVAGVPWALRADGLDVPGFAALVDGHVPVGAGLSSSAALECAVAVALDEVAGLGLGADDAGRARLASACARAENEIAGAPTGGMDQAAALRCRAGAALLLDSADGGVDQVPLDLEAAGLVLVVIDTRVHHALVDGQYGSRRDACVEAARLLAVSALGALAPADLEPALEHLRAAVPERRRADEMARRVRHVVTEVERVREVVRALRAGRPRDIGPLLDASHGSLRDDYEVSCAELDLAVDVARRAGALGARMTGGGFGGSAIALVEAGAGGPEALADTVTQAFAEAGFRPPGFLIATPSAPAGRVA